jgi:hypothetical protein
MLLGDYIITFTGKTLPFTGKCLCAYLSALVFGANALLL